MIQSNNIQEQFISIFKYNLKKDARTVSVSTLLSNRYLKRIKYDPYYQRNYIWEKDKQSFFIESIILGTEIPPIVLYKNGMTVEVIDGRQRFETLKRFKEDDFALHVSGLIELKALEGKKYSSLKPEFQQLFEDTKIRIFEFEVVGIIDLDSKIEDKIKKEIFRRYNSGITPLSQSEVDNARYDDDNFTGFLKEKLKENDNIFNIVKSCFFPNDKKSKNDLLIDMTTKLRRLLVLKTIPISRYADSGKTMLLELLYDNYINSLLENGINIAKEEEKLLNDISSIYNILPDANANIYECLYWAISILNNENISFDLKEKSNEIKDHYKREFGIYQTESDHYYGNIVARFTDTAQFMQSLFNFCYKDYLRCSDFKKKIKDLAQTEEAAELNMEKLACLRINKPSPASKPIDQVLRELEANRYLIRPSYQRQEKINIHKASAIIESILLGIKLPPLFIYVRENGIREVIDGQQRLLSIIGFLGRKYVNEEGVLTTSHNHNFRLKDLRILKDYNGCNYSDLIEDVEDRILDFDLDEIEIQQSLNPNFEPTDLFIRLNNKPYPIQQNSFEMWNSTADKDIIQAVKDVTQKDITWFYIKQPKFDDLGRRRDRMKNEEFITILSFLCYNKFKTNDVSKVLGFYPRLKNFTCRLKTKTTLTNLLESLETKLTDKEVFLSAIKRTSEIIALIKEILLNNNATKDSFNEILNIKKVKHFNRSYQEFYILWIILMEITPEVMTRYKNDILLDLSEIFKLLKNTNEVDINEQYIEKFIEMIQHIQHKYSKK